VASSYHREPCLTYSKTSSVAPKPAPTPLASTTVTTCMQMQHRHTIETHAMSGVYIYVIEHTYNVGVHTDVEDEGSGRHPLAPAEEVDGDGDLQHAARHPDDRRDHRVPF